MLEVCSKIALLAENMMESFEKLDKKANFYIKLSFYTQSIANSENL